MTSGRRLLYGGRVDLEIAFLAVLASFVLGTAIGCLAGYFGGWVDVLVMRVVDVILAFPFFVLVIALVFILGPGTKSIYIAIIATDWVSYTWIIRREIVAMKRHEFVLAAAALGYTHTRIMLRHLIPNCITQAIVYSMSDVVFTILTIVTLGFLGLGVPPPTAGVGLDDVGRSAVHHHPLGARHVPRDHRGDRRHWAVALRRRHRRPLAGGVDVTDQLLSVKNLRVDLTTAARRCILSQTSHSIWPR